jgi:hypothetical protein
MGEKQKIRTGSLLMPRQETVDVIAIEWDGPFSRQAVQSGEHLKNSSEDRGLYQIYCNHDAPNTLMYIGQTKAGYGFAGRIKAYEDWLYWEAYEPEIFVGRLRNIDPNDDYTQLLNRAELLLIYFCSPPINKHCKMAFEVVSRQPNTVLINYKKRFRLPYVISNLTEKPKIFETVSNNAAIGKTLEKMQDDNPAASLSGSNP